MKVHRVITHLADPLVGLQNENLAFVEGTREGHHIFKDIDSLETCLLEDLSQRCEEAMAYGMDIEVVRMALRQYAAAITLMVND